MFPTDTQRYEKLRALSPVEAVRAWLQGEFGIGDEPALIEAIRRDSRVILPDDDLSEVIWDAMDGELDAEACLERLAGRPLP